MDFVITEGYFVDDETITRLEALLEDRRAQLVKKKAQPEESEKPI